MFYTKVKILTDCRVPWLRTSKIRSFIMFPRLGLETARRQVNMEIGDFLFLQTELVERAVRTLHRAHSLSILTLFIIMNFKTSL